MDAASIRLFVFSSNIDGHLATALANGIWKTRSDDDQKAQAWGKAAKIHPGDLGLFFDSIAKMFTVPFVFLSDVRETENDSPFTRGGPYAFEFQFLAMGNLSMKVPASDAPRPIQEARNSLLTFNEVFVQKEKWRALLARLTSINVNDRSGNRLMKFLGIEDPPGTFSGPIDPIE